MMKVLCVAGTRPNFVKIAPIYRALKQYSNIAVKIVHTGQHYDACMSDVFFQQLALPAPDYHFEKSNGSHTQQTAHIMLAFEKVLDIEKPDIALVVGDVNSTLACALVAAQKQIRIAHVEAGLRSGDKSMPEEINRILVDVLSDYHFTTEQAAKTNLTHEGIPTEKIHFVGNCMIDSLVQYRQEASRHNTLSSLGLQPKGYVLMTMHRPSNVDHKAGLEAIITVIEAVAQMKKVVFPLHPRTRRNLEKFNLLSRLTAIDQLQLLEPQGYLSFLSLMEHAAAVLTDSGGIQEETTFLQVPCLTFRANTERPVTVEMGTNILLPDLDPNLVSRRLKQIFSGQTPKGIIPPMWDGLAGERIAAILSQTP